MTTQTPASASDDASVLTKLTSDLTVADDGDTDGSEDGGDSVSSASEGGRDYEAPDHGSAECSYHDLHAGMAQKRARIVPYIAWCFSVAALCFGVAAFALIKSDPWVVPSRETPVTPAPAPGEPAGVRGRAQPHRGDLTPSLAPSTSLAPSASLAPTAPPLTFEIFPKSGWAASGGEELMWAMCVGNDDTVSQLIAAGADVNFRDNNGPLLTTATSHGQIGVIEELLAHGADPDAASWWGWTSLHRASKYGQVDIVKMLLDYGADPNLKTDEGKTPLAYAVEWKYGHVETVEALLAHGADPNAVDNDGKTPLDYAIRCSRWGWDVSDLLRGAGGV